MAKKPLLQIKDIMAAVDRKDYNYYTNLSDEQRKSMNLWMTQRYASSVQGKFAGHYLVMINEFMNTNWSDISKHPELQWKLMCLAGVGKSQFHPFVKVPKAKRKKDKDTYKLIVKSQFKDVLSKDKVHKVSYDFRFKEV